MFNAVSYNPDVLTCLANLSSDEVFTPPKLVNDILDLLPTELWQDKNATFLDPCSKSGVFLREITKRLMAGLEQEIPDRQTRINHILTSQVFGIAITELTAHLSRRSLYCSKHANGKYSVCDTFTAEQGNLRFTRTEHTFMYNRCIYCGASQELYERGEDLETHAYQFIHKAIPEDFFEMKFDVIIGNPPYQLSDGGSGGSAVPIYNKFIQKAKTLNPRYLTMIIPARWYTGGRGLDNFRHTMLNDSRIRILHDFPKASDCFPGMEIKGGVCYFLWDRDNQGLCKIITHNNEAPLVTTERALLEKGLDIFIRYSEQISILKKVQNQCEPLFLDLVSANDPFGFDVRVEGSYKRVKPKYKLSYFEPSYKLYYFGWQKEGLGFVNPKYIRKGQDLVQPWKVFISRGYGAGDEYPHQILNKPFIGDNYSVCTETYTLIGPFDNRETAENVISYIQTRFFRFLVHMVKNTQSAAKKVFSFVPIQDFSKPWTDEELYEKYGLTEEEIAFIESMIRPMDLTNGDEDA